LLFLPLKHVSAMEVPRNIGTFSRVLVVFYFTIVYDEQQFCDSMLMAFRRQK